MACLFVLAVVRNHLSSSSFCVFRIGGVLVFVKDQGLSRVFGFSFLSVFLSFLFRRFWVSLLEGWLYWFFVRERRGGLCCVLGRFPSFPLCLAGCFPSLSFVFPSYSTHITPKYTPTHNALPSCFYTNYPKLYTLTQHIHTYKPFTPALSIKRKSLQIKILGIVYHRIV